MVFSTVRDDCRDKRRRNADSLLTFCTNFSFNSLAMTANNASPSLSLSAMREIVSDLYSPRPAVYWTDFLLTALVGNSCFALTRRMDLLVESTSLMWSLRAVSFTVCCLAFYRMAMFIHELVHLRADQMRGFRFVWNLLCGVPFLMPTFVYYTHLDHHRRKHYGTERDGEYLPLGSRSPWFMVLYMAQVLLIPPAAYFRFLVLSPLGWICPPIRRLVHQRASSMVMDPSYIRPLPKKRILRVMRIQEFLCFLWCLGLLVVPLVFLNRWPIPFMLQAYLTGVVILTLNSIRTMGAHRWTHDSNEAMSFEDQLLDSVNVAKSPWITELWGPVGTRYHALHHLFPTLPYHALAEAHQRLRENLPADSPYHKTENNSLTEVLLELWKRSLRRGSQENPPPSNSASQAI